MKRVGILTAGGDCPGLNAVIRGVAKASYEIMDDVEFVGIQEGYAGLIDGDYKKMKKEEFSGILNLGGTILGTSRRPFKMMNVIEEDNVDKVKSMIKNYEKMKLDCLLTLGGAGTHKTANLLSEKGLNVIGLPKTIDNDIFGTDVTFGYHTAIDIATDCIDRLHTTASSHGRTIVVEIMGNKAGWLTLASGIAGGADVILLPEIPFDTDEVCRMVEKRAESGKNFSIVAIAEGAMTKEEAGMKKKERAKRREEMNSPTLTGYVASQIKQKTGLDTRTCVPGHIQRGGSPSAYDRLLSTQFGVHAASLIKCGMYGTTVATVGGKITQNKLSDIAGIAKLVPENDPMIQMARNLGTIVL